MKIATWNINSIKSRIDHVLKWCGQNQPDVLCLQETKSVDEKFPYAKLARDRLSAHRASRRACLQRRRDHLKSFR
jgi:exonuclease III